MPLWIKFFDACAKYPDRGTFYIQRTLMGSSINAEREAAGDDKSSPRQAAGKRLRRIESRPGSASTADHSELRTIKQRAITGDEKKRRGIGNFSQ
jgi:hypothetical protein